MLNRLKLAIIVPLILVLTSGQTACTQNQLELVKVAGRTIERLIDTGINLVPTFVANGDLDEADTKIVLEILGGLKNSTHEFNQQMAGFTSFNPKSKADLATAFRAVASGLAMLNSEGVTRIKNPTLRGRVQIGLTAINLAASEIESIFAGTQAKDVTLERSVAKITDAAVDIDKAFEEASSTYLSRWDRQNQKRNARMCDAEDGVDAQRRQLGKK